MKPADWWEGVGGTDYTARNRVQWRKRIPFWSDIYHWTGCRSVFEAGANAGWNLSAIRQADPHITVRGCDINRTAQLQAQRCDLAVKLGTVFQTLDDVVNAYELVFTCGLLIHVPPNEIDATMRRLVDASSQWVLAIEYDADTELAIAYREQTGLLWKRPYGRLYEGLGLGLVKSGFLTPDDGFDNCTYWLLEKL